MLNLNKITLVLLIIFLSAFTHSNKGSVKLMNHQKKTVPFKIKSQKIEWVNNVINIALLSTDNQLVQINNIPESLVKDTTFRNNRVQVLMIDKNNNTFIQNKRFLPLIEIRCDAVEAGHSISIETQGKIFHQKKWYQFEVNIQSTLPKEKILGTSKRMTN
jgi:hypothetical protein